MNFQNKHNLYVVVILTLFLSFAASALVEYDQDVTPDVIFGTGNPNGFFTTDRNASAKIEVALRAKIPYSPGVTRTINSNGDGTYSYTLAETDHDDDPNTDNRWNFEFSVNVDHLDGTSSGANLDEFTYEMGVDSDPSAATNFSIGDPIHPNNGFVAPDHEMGDNLTPNGGGTIYGGWFNVSQYNTALTNNNVIQNSIYYGNFVAGYNPSVPGAYTIYLLVKDSSNTVLARTQIHVLVGGVSAPNSPPTAVDDAYSIDEDGSLNADDQDGNTDMDANNDGVLANDSDVDGNTIQVVEVGTINANGGGTGGSITMAAGGTFSYTPPADFNGDAVFDFTVTDGSLTTVSSLTITVNPVNDTPSFTKGDDETALEDAGTQTVAGWATSISTGPANESAQVLTFNVSNDNTSLFSLQPMVDETSGDLTYTPAANAHGMATVTVNLSDDGGGLDTSADQTFTIAVTSVNDAPIFDIQGDKIYYSLQNNQVQITNYTSNIVLEPNGETGQAITQYIVTIDSDTQDILNDTNGATVDNTGILTLDFNINNFGTAILTISLQDNAGGNDTSAGISFNISHLKDAMFSDGFEEIVVIKVFELITESYNNPMFDSLPIQDLPYYDEQTDSLVLLGHKMQLKGDYESPQISKVLQNWIEEVMALEKAK